MNLLKILIVDDESLARDRLRSIIEELDAGQIIGEANNGQQALEVIQKEDPDIVLMDIRMPGMDGIEAAKHVTNLEHPPAVIFTTAYGDYALDAFDAHAMDYLLKPIRKERLQEAITRVRTLSQPKINSIQKDLQKTRTHISAVLQGNLQLVPVDQIIYFRADQKYVSVFSKNGEVLIEEPLKSLEEEFAETFLRIHRNTLVAKSSIEGLEKDGRGGWNIKLADISEVLPVSRRLQSGIRKYIRSCEIEYA